MILIDFGKMSAVVFGMNGGIGEIKTGAMFGMNKIKSPLS